MGRYAKGVLIKKLNVTLPFGSCSCNCVKIVNPPWGDDMKLFVARFDLDCGHVLQLKLAFEVISNGIDIKQTWFAARDEEEMASAED